MIRHIDVVDHSGVLNVEVKEAENCIDCQQ